jgi:hypothetical protein
MAVTHLANVADRIDRSISPEAEGRSGNLSSFVKDHAALAAQ